MKKDKVKGDVALLLEGTYPYVGGGVSSWVHQIIRGMPHLTFGIVFLGGSRESYGEMKYKLPDNVVYLKTHYLMDSWRSGRARARPGRADAFADVKQLHEFFRTPQSGLPAELMKRIAEAFGAESGISREDFLHSEESWNRVCADYRDNCTDPSFVDYFWTVRTMHAPLFALAEIARTLPEFRCFHAVSTGYAGFLATLLHHRTGRPLILSEHGIYTKERKIDLAQADWIKDARELFAGGLDDDVSYIRRLWIRFFEGIGRITYDSSHVVIGLYEGIRSRQIADGAARERTRIVPNGVDVPRFSALRPKRPPHIPMVCGLLGRVVPIKDIRTFVRAMRTVCTRIPEAEGWVIGPEDEDEAYAKECKELVNSLGLEGRVKFLGFQKPDDILPKMGLMVLTSISEALPLVILEGYAAGLPCVATDVGACSELLYGGSEEDQALGHAGKVVSIADPEATAEACISLLTDEARWHKAQEVAIKRVETYYTQPRMFESYKNFYKEALEL
jgi:glycosyltransferase involved in cell wall biosynthesis